METLTLTDSQWADVLHALRSTAEANSNRVLELRTMNMPLITGAFEEQAARLFALADLIESD